MRLVRDPPDTSCCTAGACIARASADDGEESERTRGKWKDGGKKKERRAEESGGAKVSYTYGRLHA